ncbi:hypothetical protein VPH35_010463 [Triticum aestivum]
MRSACPRFPRVRPRIRSSIRTVESTLRRFTFKVDHYSSVFKDGCDSMSVADSRYHYLVKTLARSVVMTCNFYELKSHASFCSISCFQFYVQRSILTCKSCWCNMAVMFATLVDLL